MPALYAHDRFGTAVSCLLDGEIKEIVETYNSQFRIGLQGPDIFFFYGAHSGNSLVRFGNHLHGVSAMPFFRHAVRTVKKYGRNSKEYAYLLGFLCHFILDSECHPYVTEMIEETGVQHLEIEEEFEKLLLRRDGRDPVAFPLASLVPTDWETAEAIQPFFPIRIKWLPFSGRWMSERRYIPVATIQRALKDLKWIKKLFTAPQPWKQAVITKVMKTLGVWAPMNGLMNQPADNPLCAESNAGLKARFDGAIPLAVRMIYNLDAGIRNGSPLDERFDRTFC